MVQMSALLIINAFECKASNLSTWLLLLVSLLELLLALLLFYSPLSLQIRTNSLFYIVFLHAEAEKPTIIHSFIHSFRLFL